MHELNGSFPLVFACGDSLANNLSHHKGTPFAGEKRISIVSKGRPQIPLFFYDMVARCIFFHAREYGVTSCIVNKDVCI